MTKAEFAERLKNACQTVKHMHYHVLGGEKLSERMA